MNYIRVLLNNNSYTHKLFYLKKIIVKNSKLKQNFKKQIYNSLIQ